MEFAFIYVLLFVTQGNPSCESIIDTLTMQTVPSFIARVIKPILDTFAKAILGAIDDL